MRTKWSGVGMGAAVMLVVAAQQAWGQGTRPTRDFMRQKLGYTQGIVEGLVTEQYTMVVTNASSLRSMNLTNAFMALKNPYYVENIANFQAKVDKLIKAAQAKDPGKSTKQYSAVMESCVACHKLFRREQFLESLNR